MRVSIGKKVVKIREIAKEKAGKRKDEIRASLLKRGINEEKAIDYAKAKKTKILYYFIIIVLAVLLIVLSYLFFYKQKILKEELKPTPSLGIDYSKFDHRISLNGFNFPDTAQQLENITARFYWSVREPIAYEGIPMLFFIDQDGNILYTKALYDQGQRSTLEFMPNHTYEGIYNFQIPALPAGKYSINYTLAHRDTFELSQTFDGRTSFFLKSITIKENAAIYPCGLIVGWVRNGSLIEKANFKAGDEIIKINGHRLSNKNTHKNIEKGIFLENGEFVNLSKKGIVIEFVNNKTYTTMGEIGPRSISLDFKICSSSNASSS